MSVLQDYYMSITILNKTKSPSLQKIKKFFKRNNNKGPFPVTANGDRILAL